jgi:hypothetical protein
VLVSHRHGFIFQHCRKAAGSSVNVSLYRHLGPRDVTTECWNDAIEHGVRPNLHAVRWALRPPGARDVVRSARDGRAEFAEQFNRSLKATARQRLDAPRPPSTHLLAAEVRERYPSEWADYLTFCVVRNPYDRAVSDYFWRTKRCTERPSFRTYLEAMAAGDRLDGIVDATPDNWPFYAIDGDIAVDRVCRFEHLTEDLTAVLAEVGIDWDGWLPRAKSGTGRRPYREMYDDPERALVEQLFGHEIAAFGYTF